MSNKVDALQSEDGGGSSKPPAPTRSNTITVVRDRPKDAPKEKSQKTKKKPEENQTTASSCKVAPVPRAKSAKARMSSSRLDSEKEDLTLQEWQREHIVTLINSSPFPSYAKCVRMSSVPPRTEHAAKPKEIKVKEVEKEPKPKEVTVKEVEKEAKPKEVKVKPVKAKGIQTKNRIIQVAPSIATKAVQTSGISWSQKDVEKSERDEPAISQSAITEMGENINSIYYIVKDIEEKADNIKEIEDEILAACQDVTKVAPNQDISDGGEPCKCQHLMESDIKEISNQINLLQEFTMEKFGNEGDPQNIVEYLDERLSKMQEELRHMKEEVHNNSSPPPPMVQTREGEENVDAYISNVENIIRIGHRNTNSYIQRLATGIKELRDIAEMLETGRPTAQPEVVHATDPNSEEILSTVQRVHDVVLNKSPHGQGPSVPIAEPRESPPKDPYMGDCRCDHLRNGIPKQRNNVKTTSRGFKESIDLCQRCINDYRGRVFVNIRNLPPSSNENLTRILGQIIECLEHDNHKQLSHFMGSLFDQAEDWTEDDITNAYLGLFRISLAWNNIRCPLVLSNYMNVNALIENEFGSRIKYQKSAFDVLGQLLCGFDPALQMAYITGPELCGSLFDAVATRNVIAFNFLVCNNASLDEIREGRSVLHEIVFQSHKHGGAEEEKSWNESLLKMLDIVYEHAGPWWQYQSGRDTTIPTTEDSASENESVTSEKSAASSVQGSPMRSQPIEEIGEEFNLNALRYLLSITDNKGRSPLQYASQYASVDIVQRILSEPPYRFLPDPFDFTYDAHTIGYVMEDMDGSSGGKGVSVLDRILMRPPKEASKMLSIEPFKSMISDRWHRYYIFGWIWFLIYLYYISVFTACVLYRPTNRSSLFAMYSSKNDTARLVGEIFILLGLFCFVYGEIRDLFRLGWVWPWPWTFNGLSRLINLLFFILVLCAICMRLSTNENEDVVFSLALVTGWLNAIYFLVMCRTTRLIPYILHTIFIWDFCARFLLLFMLALIATSTATYCTYQEANHRIPGVNTETFWDTPFLLYQVYFGLGTTDHVPESRNTGIGYTLFIFHIWIFGFIFMNLLIAMIIHTYMVIKRDEKSLCLWLKAWVVQLLDRRLPPCLVVSYESDRTCIAMCRSGKLKYRLRSCLRKNADGKVVVVKERVVLLSQD